MQISELVQGPETLTRITDGALDLSFFPTGRWVAGFRTKAVFAGEGEKAWQEADQPTVVLGDRGRQIVIILWRAPLCGRYRRKRLRMGTSDDSQGT
jgi:hypothetical protein